MGEKKKERKRKICDSDKHKGVLLLQRRDGGEKEKEVEEE